MVLVAEVQGAELGVLGLECRIEGCGCEGLWFMVDGLWFMVYGLWFRVYGLGLGGRGSPRASPGVEVEVLGFMVYGS